MRSSFVLAIALCAVAYSAPTFSHVEGDGEQTIVDNYFSTLAKTVASVKRAGSPAAVCDLSKAEMPVAPTPLPGPSEGLTLKHVAIGRGIQNYTCGTNSSAAPVSVGAVADLFNASCIASSYSDLLSVLPGTALQFNYSPKTNITTSKTLSPMGLSLSGHHFFTNTTTPYFNLDASSSVQMGQIPAAKINTTNAPTTSVKGQNDEGNGACAWLKLQARDDATGSVQEVYRINTAGGNSPKTCEGIESSAFSVEYSAEYWFYSS